MPRTTRAALRSKELAEEETIAASVPLPPTPSKERVPLGEVAHNKVAALMVIENADSEQVFQGAKKGRKGKGAKKGSNKKVKDKSEDVDIEILEEKNQSPAGSAAEVIHEDIVNDQSDQPSSGTDDDAAVASFAVNVVSETPKSISTPQLTMEETRSSHESEMTQVPYEEPGSVSGTNEDAKEDSFVQQITSRSPAKRVSRIEDSVEALDQLDEEIEKVGQAMTPPPIANGLPPPSKADQLGSTTSNSLGKVVNEASQEQNGVSVKVANGDKKPVKRSVPAGPKGIRPKENRASLLRQGIKPTSPVRAERPAPRTKAPAASATIKSSGPALGAAKVTSVDKSFSQSSDSTKKVSGPGARRVSSVTKAPFLPAKSTKAPTQATFELPGEAISRRKKEQRDERLKKEEEEKLKKRSFKARPMSMGHAPEVKMTTATKARLSVAKQPATGTSQNPVKRPSPLVSSVSSLSSVRRSSSLTVQKRSPPLANSTARRAPSRSSISGEVRSAPTAEDLAHQKVKGKEAFSRPRNEIVAREKERREKEEAAKRARIEAAERGRAASREWAEKQKARKAAEAAAKGNVSA